MVGRKLAVLSLNTVKTYWVPRSHPNIWRNIPKIGRVWTLRTLAFWMYDHSCRQKNVFLDLTLLTHSLGVSFELVNLRACLACALHTVQLQAFIAS